MKELVSYSPPVVELSPSSSRLGVRGGAVGAPGHRSGLCQVADAGGAPGVCWGFHQLLKLYINKCMDTCGSHRSAMQQSFRAPLVREISIYLLLVQAGLGVVLLKKHYYHANVGQYNFFARGPS